MIASVRSFQAKPLQRNLSTYVKCYTLRSYSSTQVHAKSTKNKSLTYADILELEDGVINPSMYWPKIPKPKSLSPSSAAEFKACPQSYLFQYLYGIRQPTTLALARGRVCHAALEEVFDLQQPERTLDNLQNLFRKNWSESRMTDEYVHLFDSEDEETGTLTRNIEAERKWGQEALGLLQNYFELEDPSLIPQPNPLEREMWVQAKLTLDTNKGATGETPVPDVENVGIEPRFLVRGIVDRLDFVAVPPSPRRSFVSEDERQDYALRIVDYKTGKSPYFKYSPATNIRIANENMWQLKIYALLIREMIANGKTRSKGGNLKNVSAQDIRLLRLLYLTSQDGKATYLDYDLGETYEERNKNLHEIHNDLIEIWEGIISKVNTQDPSQFHHCDRKFCTCHKLRPKFMEGVMSQQAIS